MAKRMKLEAPSSEDLIRMEGEFRRETLARNPLAVPIAQVAADSARAHDPRTATERADVARDRADAERMRLSEEKGLVLLEIPVDRIDADALVRDRIALDPEAMRELQMSISAQGLRLPIEVFVLPNDPTRYGLLSGYRRLRAVQNLRGLKGQGGHDTIRAIIREPDAMGGTFAAMVEENEIRAGLSHFERGRISVIAAQQGAFPNVEAAVAALFPVASKGKRSKIRSFATIFEELGDMLLFPDSLREKDGLKLAAALRDGREGALRKALADASPADPATEWEVLDMALASFGPAAIRPERGGRPSVKTRDSTVAKRRVDLELGHDQSGWFIRLQGADLDEITAKAAVRELQRIMNQP
ncbi:ParB/RepB/Spo0J family partition protein [Falsirhodobacter halotolerans]|uniref:ParB/RepB/Spo0J family partition protein n=1 Tax=Falsirhodobacter halotolerans TaxID=1146892 RepID=UPI001FD10780|nr:ParB N-terminal domain-containing protein [Falsirhodobacter halotolerans]MCJ8141278.1 ParB N-terminal domain-containing protein [Falsirhodobacter halotolerans]